MPTIVIKKGWHINSHHPIQDYLIPTSIGLVDNPFWKLGRVAYPEGEEVTLPFSPEPLSVYRVSVEIPVTLEREGESVPSTTLHLVVGFQPCNDTSCSAPVRLTLPVPLSSGFKNREK